MAPKADPVAYPPRGLSREHAARYLGIGTTLFDEMVADRRMPRPKKINNRSVWDRVSLDMAFENLPEPDDRAAFKRALEASIS
jgi:predicted DNA-binding transcriptional regulator AlpA